VSVNVPYPVTPGRTVAPVYRYWNGNSNDHFYTTNSGEISGGHSQGYSSEGVAFQLSSLPSPGLVPVYRYFKHDVKDHFYTTNTNEIGVLTAGMTGKHGYVCEGILGYISPTQIPGTVPVYRYWKPSDSDHFYTTNTSEIGVVVVGSSGNHGYVCEGILGYAFI